MAVIGGSAFDILADQEHWPFSQYPMFSGLWTSPTFTWLRLFGVTADGREFALDANRYVAPFDQSRLPKALKRMVDDPHGDGVLDRLDVVRGPAPEMRQIHARTVRQWL